MADQFPTPDAWGRLYDAASRLVSAIGYHGERARWDAEVLTLQECLRELDDGEHINGLMPPSASEAAQRARMEARFKDRQPSPATADFDLPAPSTPAPALSDEQILSCMGDKQPVRISARHGAAIFEYRLFGLIHFARAVLAIAAPSTPAPSDPLPDQDAIEADALRSFDKQGHPEHTVESYVAGWVDCIAALAAPSTPAAKERPAFGLDVRDYLDPETGEPYTPARKEAIATMCGWNPFPEDKPSDADLAAPQEKPA